MLGTWTSRASQLVGQDVRVGRRGRVEKRENKQLLIPELSL